MVEENEGQKKRVRHEIKDITIKLLDSKDDLDLLQEGDVVMAICNSASPYLSVYKGKNDEGKHIFVNREGWSWNGEYGIAEWTVGRFPKRRGDAFYLSNSGLEITYPSESSEYSKLDKLLRSAGLDDDPNLLLKKKEKKKSKKKKIRGK